MRILFAAPEGRTNTLKKMGAKGIITSYAHWSRRSKFDKSLRDFEFVFVDSGANAFVKKATKSLKLPNPDQYLNEYITFLKENWDCIDYFTELDIAHAPVFKREGHFPVKGKQWVVDARKRFAEEGLGDKLVPVYHESYMDLTDFKALCAEYQYVALEEFDEIRIYRQLFDIAERTETKLHGFSMTKQEFLKKLPFYSVDSSSWLNGSRFGDTYEFKTNKLYLTKDKSYRTTMKTMLMNNDIDSEAVLKDDPNAVDEMNVLAWMQYNEFLNIYDDIYWRKGLVPSDVVHLDSAGNPIRSKAIIELKNPEAVEIAADIQRRKAELDPHQRAMIQSTLDIKRGKYSPYKEIPAYIQQYMEDIDYLDLGDPDEIKKVLYALIRQNLKRIAVGQALELEDGMAQDRALTKLINDTMAILRDLAQPPKGSQVGTTNNTQINIGETKGLGDNERLSARAAIADALDRIRRQTQE